MEDFLGKGKADLLEHVRAAQDIRIVGVTLSRTLRDLVDELQRRAVAGAVVKVALIDPAGSAPEEAARRSTIPDRAGMGARPTGGRVGRLRRSRGGVTGLWIFAGFQLELAPGVLGVGVVRVNRPGSGSVRMPRTTRRFGFARVPSV
ncbi:hypothetical protein ACIRYZ_40755 [Kitasatospora sp. NPDC101155]|uniref:hypothetical protein n=1 Tax=Kitasatospora sp. NPDC101155 TaxID=3364097 RepID=UPI0037F38DAA